MKMKICRYLPHIVLCLLICITLAVSAAAENGGEQVPIEEIPPLSQEELNLQRAEVAKQEAEDARIASQYFHSEEDIQYYAYLDYASAEEELKPVILAARDRIIYRYSWVANGLSGDIIHVDGSRDPLPEFSDLFPADWQEPVGVPCGLDKEYCNIQ